MAVSAGMVSGRVVAMVRKVAVRFYGARAARRRVQIGADMRKTIHTPAPSGGWNWNSLLAGGPPALPRVEFGSARPRSC